jgi:hypothetical protein
MYEYIGILLGARPILHISRIKVKPATEALSVLKTTNEQAPRPKTFCMFWPFISPHPKYISRTYASCNFTSLRDLIDWTCQAGVDTQYCMRSVAGSGQNVCRHCTRTVHRHCTKLWTGPKEQRTKPLGDGLCSMIRLPAIFSGYSEGYLSRCSDITRWAAGTRGFSLRNVQTGTGAHPAFC